MVLENYVKRKAEICNSNADIISSDTRDGQDEGHEVKETRTGGGGRIGIMEAFWHSMKCTSNGKKNLG